MVDRIAVYRCAARVECIQVQVQPAVWRRRRRRRDHSEF